MGVFLNKTAGLGFPGSFVLWMKELLQAI